ncbi:S-layer homology domain-containing protein, partial [Lysinibacillus sp. D4A1_S13]|uniref:S-layer homology domain-containing protein n=1 Tax=Lysinibacillus sp. D4A1_S13 TaxID=2941228 RepID=UPI0020BFEDEA
TLNNPYRDIRAGSTLFPEEVLTLTKLGFFNGGGNGGFRPKDSVSRAELAQIIKNAFQVSAKLKHTFNDV